MSSFTCKDCHVTKPLTEFYKSRKKTAGVRSVCKVCLSKNAPEAKKENVICQRCGIEHGLWHSTLLKRIERKYSIPTACEDCYERPTTDWSAVWDYYAKVKGITN